MNHTQFYDQLKKNDLARVYLFQGDEEYVKSRALSALREKLIPVGLEQLNDTTLEGVTAQRIIETAETLPFMAEKRLVTVRDWAPLMTGQSKDEVNEVARMKKWLANPPESTVLVFYMRGVASSRAMGKALTQEGLAQVVQFSELQEKELLSWIGKEFKRLGKTMSAADMRFFVDQAGQSLIVLEGEIQKLAGFAGERQAITRDDVRSVVTPSVEYQIYKIMEELVAGNAAEGFAAMKELLQAGEDRIPMLALFERQLANLSAVADARERGELKPETLKILGMKSYPYDMAVKQLANLKPGAAKELYEKAVEYDFSIKSGRMRDQAALEGLMLDILRAAK